MGEGVIRMSGEIISPYPKSLVTAVINSPLFKTYKEKAGTDRAHALWNECAPKDFQIVEKGEAS